MKKSTRVYKEYITDLKRLFDDHNVKRMNVEDSFFMEIINIIENKKIKMRDNPVVLLPNVMLFVC